MSEKDALKRFIEKASGSRRPSVFANQPINADSLNELLSLEPHPDTYINLQDRTTGELVR